MDIFGLSLSVSSVLLYLINALLAWIALIVSDSIIAHNIEAKKTLILSLAAFFIVPLLLPIVGLGALGATIVVSAVVWIGLGELILEADSTEKLKVLAIGFAVYYVISLFLAGYIFSFLSSFL